MARPKAADAKATQTAILDAAEDAFAAHGFAGARMTPIAKNAGVTHAMLHYYFDNKETLYRQVVDRLFGRHLALLANQIQQPMSREQFRHLIMQSFDLFWAHPNQIQIMLWEMAAGDDRVERITRPFYDAIIAALPEPRRDAPAIACAPHDRRDVYTTLLGSLVVYFFRDPALKHLYGENRFGAEDHQRRRAHIGALIDLFF